MLLGGFLAFYFVAIPQLARSNQIEVLLQSLDVLSSELAEISATTDFTEETFRKIEEANPVIASGAILATRQVVVEQRLKDLEQAIKLSPDQVVQLSLVSAEINSIKQEFNRLQEATSRELDIVLNIVLTLIGGTLFAIFLLFLTQLGKRTENK